MHEFVEWPKTKRLFRDIVVTEKLDGTNSAIHISRVANLDSVEGLHTIKVADEWFAVSTQSRKRIITPGKTTDNFGFAGWVYDNAEELVRVLGEGLHFGEWWGQGIQRRYDMDRKVFSLFNTARWQDIGYVSGDEFPVGDAFLSAVPILYTGVFDEAQIKAVLQDLKENGSVAAPGFMNPEGICIYHTQTRGVFKVTLDHNDAGKWEVAA